MTTQPSAPVSLPPLPQGLAPLPHLGVIRARGEEAAAFLQGQLSNDVQLLKPGQARLAAYCSPKGRVLAAFIVYKEPAQVEGQSPDLLLVCARDLLAATLKRLSMFVLRAKVKLSDASDDYRLFGFAGTHPALAGLAPEPWTGAALPTAGAAIRLQAAAGQPRALLIAPAGDGPVLADAAEQATADWLWLDTLAGVPLVSNAVTDQFVPQMLNYESTGGVNFKKGCYPGQEVVARSQFRGTLKRRLYIVQSPVPLQAGQDVLQGPKADEITGLVVQSAPVPQAEAALWLANVSVQIAAVESTEGLYVTGPDGQFAPLMLIERPYDLLQDI
ncbi:MAG: tRNA-modifying protein YgfZ [Paracidovorax wautersii]|uniref:tRNA-modifying protein YgfZ n=1 Tax=Paracidovorax wautersii TaxID=1177982 RepID=A0A7V8FND2_9BURK|nr:MAG: tRNA-modifying protein YgfZ [Paracidovorax wautersii]